MRVTDRSGLAEGLFERWRYTVDGQPDPTFPLNKPAAQGCSILIAGDNFGSGSSREHAPWALMGWGIRAVISTSIADIFRSNALKNGLLPVVVEGDFHRKALALAEAWFATSPNGKPRQEMQAPFEVRISVEAQMVSLPDGSSTQFSIDPFSKTCLLKGVDPLGYLLSHLETIQAFEAGKLTRDNHQ